MKSSPPRAVPVVLFLLLLPLLAGCDPGAEQPAPPPPTITTSPATKTETIADTVDLTADKPEAAAAKPQAAALLTAFHPAVPLNNAATRCYALLADLKSNMEAISADLDAGGKEITRLTRTSDAVAQNITDLSKMWPGHEVLRDLCSGAKRQALVLNEELSRVPRKWTHVRWSFNATLQDVSKLRLYARDLAESEPKPIPAVGKDGKPLMDKEGRPIYIDPPVAAVDAAVAKREESVREVKAQRDRIKKLDEEKTKKPLKTELD